MRIHRLIGIGGFLLHTAWVLAQPPQLEPVRALLVPRTEAVISSELNGRIIALNVDLGDRFEQGDVLVRFDCRVEQTRRDKAKAELDAAIQTHRSQRKLKSLASVSQLQLALAAAGEQQARADLATIDARLQRCIIKAPFGGRVVSRKINASEFVTQGEELLEILDDRELHADLFVPSDWISWLEIGTGFTIEIAETGGQYPARVERIGPRIDPVSQTLSIRGRLLEQAPELLAGMSGKARFSRATE